MLQLPEWPWQHVSKAGEIALEFIEHVLRTIKEWVS